MMMVGRLFGAPYEHAQYGVPTAVWAAQPGSGAESGEGYSVRRDWLMKHNVYFDGKVQSLALETENGSATIGVITPGRYTFSTSTEERMVVTSGVLRAKLPEETGWGRG